VKLGLFSINMAERFADLQRWAESAADQAKSPVVSCHRFPSILGVLRTH
jgi:hypothetical protein